MGALLVLAACGDEDDTGDGDGGGDDRAAELWDEIQGYESWDQPADWQGVQPSLDGTHGATVQIWQNAAVTTTIAAGGGGTMPDGATLVKEGYDDAGDVRFITVMKKVEGFAPDSGDWYWASYREDGTVAASGAETQCITCHAAGQDYLWSSTW